MIRSLTPLHALQIAVALLCGGVLAMAFPPLSQLQLVWVALAPLLVIIRHATPRFAFLCGWLNGCVFWLLTLGWMWRLTENNGPWFLVYPAWFFLSLYLALYTGLFALAAAWLRRRFPGQKGRVLMVALGEPLLWAGAEYIRATLLTGFSWNTLAVALVPAPVLIQGAALGGAYFVSAVVVAGNGGIATLFENGLRPLFLSFLRVAQPSRPLRERIGRGVEILLPLLVVLANSWWGLNRCTAWVKFKYPTARILAVQTDKPCVFTPKTADDIRARAQAAYQQSESFRGLEADLILWPESALYGTIPYDESWLRFARNCASAARTPLLTGGTFLLESPDRHYNAAMLFKPGATDLPAYGKRHLVPFGEYIPFDKTFTALQSLVPSGVSCTPGESVKTLTLPLRAGGELLTGPLICFEDTVAPLARDATLNGARLLLNLTNDAWFTPSSEGTQHAHQAVLRCVETGLPMVRSTNGGITCAITPIGTIQASIPLGAAGFIVTEVPVLDAPFGAPLSLRLGDWAFGIPAAAFLLAVLIAAWLTRKKCSAAEILSN